MRVSRNKPNRYSPHSLHLKGNIKTTLRKCPFQPMKWALSASEKGTFGPRKRHRPDENRIRWPAAVFMAGLWETLRRILFCILSVLRKMYNRRPTSFPPPLMRCVPRSKIAFVASLSGRFLRGLALFRRCVQGLSALPTTAGYLLMSLSGQFVPVRFVLQQSVCFTCIHITLFVCFRSHRAVVSI